MYAEKLQVQTNISRWQTPAQMYSTAVAVGKTSNNEFHAQIFHAENNKFNTNYSQRCRKSSQDQLVDPDKQGNPDQLVNPGQPVHTDETVNPVEPVNPDKPINPDEPVNPDTNRSQLR